MSARVQAAADAEDLEALFDSVAAARAAAIAPPARADDSGVLPRIGRIARALNDSLRVAGFASAEQSTPGARDRLAYVAAMNGKAAEKALTAAETARPIQDRLAHDAERLSSRWDELLATQPGVDEFKALVHATREFLREVPEHARATNTQLTAVVLAQDFHDLTGQVIGRISDVVVELESELAGVLDESASARRTDGTAPAEAAADRRRVDALLESLGF